MRTNGRPRLTLEWLAGYGLGSIGMLCERAWRMSGKLRVIHRERIPHQEKPIVIASNHPGMAEAVFLPFVFAGPIPLRPRLIPLSTPDKSNFHDKWYWSWARSFFIEIDRADGASKKAAYRRIAQELEACRRIVIFLETGRTTSVADGHVYSPSGKHKVRPFVDSVGSIVQRLPECTVLPVWVRGSEEFLPRGTWLPRFSRQVTVTVGNPLVYHEERVGGQRRIRAAEITQEIQSSVLALADENEVP